MRNKALLGLAALAVTAATAVAQSNVYSLNIVGYINVPVSAGFNAIANQLKNGNNGADVVLPATDSSQVLKWNGTAFDAFTYDSGFGGWIDAGFNPAVPTINPGEGFFYFAPANATLTLVGEVATAPGTSTTNVISTGFQLVASKLPYGGAVDGAAFNLPVQDSVQVLQWNGLNGYNTATFDSGFGGWIDDGFNPIAAPSINVGQGFFYFNPAASANWVQSLP